MSGSNNLVAWDALSKEEQKVRQDAFMMKKFGHESGEKHCTYNVAQDCVHVSDPFDFRVNSNMCKPCYSYKQKERALKKQKEIVIASHSINIKRKSK